MSSGSNKKQQQQQYIITMSTSSLLYSILFVCFAVLIAAAATTSTFGTSFIWKNNNNKPQQHNTVAVADVVTTTAVQQQQQASTTTTTTTTTTLEEDEEETNNNNNEDNVVGELIEETGFYQSIRLKENSLVISKQSQYQKIEIRESDYYGRILVLDDVTQLTERDADSYNEMLAHIPMFQHVQPKNVLIIGGGDGYVLSEVLKHTSVQHVDHVDLDQDVITICKEYFSWGNAWNDPRVTLHITDGSKFVNNIPNNYYDVIIQDSSDPWTWGENGERIILPSSVLYSKEHFLNLYRILTPNGILNLQAESIQIPSDLDGAYEWRQLLLNIGFQSSKYGSITISSYPTGQIGFLLCEKQPQHASTIQHIQQRFDHIVKIGKSTTYYHPPLQSASFILPLWAQQHIYNNDNDNASPSCAVDDELSVSHLDE